MSGDDPLARLLDVADPRTSAAVDAIARHLGVRLGASAAACSTTQRLGRASSDPVAPASGGAVAELPLPRRRRGARSPHGGSTMTRKRATSSLAWRRAAARRRAASVTSSVDRRQAARSHRARAREPSRHLSEPPTKPRLSTSVASGRRRRSRTKRPRLRRRLATASPTRLRLAPRRRRRRRRRAGAIAGPLRAAAPICGGLARRPAANASAPPPPASASRATRAGAARPPVELRRQRCGSDGRSPHTPRRRLAAALAVAAGELLAGAPQAHSSAAVLELDAQAAPPSDEVRVGGAGDRCGWRRSPW